MVLSYWGRLTRNAIPIKCNYFDAVSVDASIFADFSSITDTWLLQFVTTNLYIYTLVRRRKEFLAFLPLFNLFLTFLVLKQKKTKQSRSTRP